MQSPPPGPGSGGGLNISLPSVDWTQLIPQLLGLMTRGLGEWLTGAMHSTFDPMWSGGHNVVGQTDLAMVWGFAPVQAQIADVQTAARSVLMFALVLLGLRSMLGGIVTTHHHQIGEAINGVLLSVILVAAFPVVVPEGIGLVNQAATAVAGATSLSAYASAMGSGGDPLVAGVLFVILAFFAARLIIKAVWRIGYLAVLAPVGLAACALYGIPQTRWLLTWWARTWGGMLLAQIPSVFALSVGAGLFLGGQGGGGSFLYSIAFLQLATDLYSLIPFGTVGHSGSPISAIGQGLAVTRLAGGMIGGGVQVASAAVSRSRSMERQYGYVD